jgi:hypothetical protein
MSLFCEFIFNPHSRIGLNALLVLEIIYQFLMNFFPLSYLHGIIHA